MQTYVHDSGIGAWDIYEFNPGNVRDVREYGQPVERSWRLQRLSGTPGADLKPDATYP